MDDLHEGILEEFTERASYSYRMDAETWIDLHGFGISGHRWAKQTKQSYDIKCRHKDRPYEALGLCKSCYTESKRKAKEAADPQVLARRRAQKAEYARKRYARKKQEKPVSVQYG